MKERILLVDDEAGIRTVLSLALQDAGYDVAAAADGKSALDELHRQDFAVVVTDMKMPGMDGLKLLEVIKREHPDIEVIIITGHGDMDSAVESMRRGAADFILKPIHEDALEIAVGRALERIAVRNQLRSYTEHLEHLVEEKSRKLIEAERLAAVGAASAGIAHAVKNIAGGLEGGMYVLGQGLEQSNTEYLHNGYDMVRRDAGRMKDLAMQLLNFGKPAKLQPVLMDPAEPAREAVAMLTPKADELGVKLELSAGDDLPKARLDAEAVHGCLVNLIDNALDAYSETDAYSEINAGAETESKKNRRVLVKITADNGQAAYSVEDKACGMSDEVRAKIFASFFSTKGSKGNGIGLMSVKKVMDAAGGGIEVESQIGRGSRFVLRFPMNSAAS